MIKNIIYLSLKWIGMMCWIKKSMGTVFFSLQKSFLTTGSSFLRSQKLHRLIVMWAEEKYCGEWKSGKHTLFPLLSALMKEIRKVRPFPSPFVLHLLIYIAVRLYGCHAAGNQHSWDQGRSGTGCGYGDILWPSAPSAGRLFQKKNNTEPTGSYSVSHWIQHHNK